MTPHENLSPRDNTFAFALAESELSVDRLPVFCDLMRQLVAQLARDFLHHYGIDSSVSIDEISIKRPSEYPADSICEIARTIAIGDWGSRLAICLSKDFLFYCIDAMYGGAGTESVADASRELSKIEKSVASSLIEIIFETFRQKCAFTDIPLFESADLNVNFKIPEFTDGNSALFTTLHFTILGRSGPLALIVPVSAFKALRRMAPAGASQKAKSASSPDWNAPFARGLGVATVKLRALIREGGLSLASISNLRVGQILELQSPAEAKPILEANGEPVFSCSMGQAEGRFTVQIDRNLNEFGQNLASGSIRNSRA